MKAYHHEFQRDYNGVVHAQIWISTKDNDGRKVKFDFDFDCLPYILRDLSKIWQEERKSRLGVIQSLNQSLPDHQ